MLVPILQPIPVVEKYAHKFKAIFANEPEYEQFKNYLSGLVVVERKNFSQIASRMINSADKTNISRFMNNERWSGEEFNDERVELIYQRTKQYDSNKPGYLIFDDTLDEHVGTMFEHIARHYDHSDGSYKLAQNPVTSHYVRGTISFPVAFRSYHNYDKVTNWEEHFRKNFPEIKIPAQSKERNKLKKKYETQLLSKDQEFAAKHAAFKTKITLACELVEDAISRDLAFSVVLFDAWYLAPELIAVIEKYQKAWISILKPNRKLQANSLKIYDQDGNRIVFEDGEIKVEDLINQIPKSAYQAVVVNEETTYWAFSFTAQIATLGKVRLVISFDNEKCEGNYVILVTRQTYWEAKRIILTYCCRFQIEVFYKDAKQQLGFSDYQCRKEPAIEKHWYLVFCAYSLLKLDMLQAPVYQTWQRKLKTISVAVRRQAQAVIEKLILTSHKLLSIETNPKALFSFLFGKLA
jgi:hypothetical protein